MTPITPDLSIRDIDGEPVVQLSWDDYIEISKFLEDTKRYLSENKLLVCGYRVDLKEEYCQ